jgi:hypothetical protein
MSPPRARPPELNGGGDGMAAKTRRDNPSCLRLPVSLAALVLAEMYREDVELLIEPYHATHVSVSWSRSGIGRMAVRIPVDDVASLEIVRRAATDKHLGVELEALLAHCLQVDGLEDAFRVRQVLELTLGADPGHPERHSPHVRAFLDLLAHGSWHLAMNTSDGTEDVVVDWEPLIRVETGRFVRRSTLSVYPPFKEALTSETAEVAADIFSLTKPENYSNTEGRLPSLATRARMRLGVNRAPQAANRKNANRKGWRKQPGEPLDLPAHEILTQLAGINIDKVKKRGRAAAWFDALAAMLPGRAHNTHTASRILDTPIRVDAPPPPPVPARRGPPRASPAFG